MTSATWIWQRTSWPNVTWSLAAVTDLHAQIGELWTATQAALLPLDRRDQQELTLEGMARVLALAVSIHAHRNEYYRVLEQCQRGGVDITAWMQFHARMVLESLNRLQDGIRRVIGRGRFWQRHATAHLRPEQRKLLLRMWSDSDDRVDDGIDANRYGRLCGVSKPTATRHLTELADAGILVRTGAGRTTRYVLVVEQLDDDGQDFSDG